MSLSHGYTPKTYLLFNLKPLENIAKQPRFISPNPERDKKTTSFNCATQQHVKRHAFARRYMLDTHDKGQLIA